MGRPGRSVQRGAARALVIERPRGRPPSPTRLAAIAVVGFALGFGLVVLRAGGVRVVPASPHGSGPPSVESDLDVRDHATAPDPATGTHRAHASASGAGGEQGASGTRLGGMATPRDDTVRLAQDHPAQVPPTLPQTALDSFSPAPPRLDGSDAAPPEVGGLPAVPHEGPRRVEPGRVAYLRCDGLPRRPGPTPCPRDQALETAVWSTLDTLVRCEAAPEGLGESDLRLELVPGQPTTVRLGAVRPGRSRLEGVAILRCLAGPLSHVRSQLGASRLVVSFRFALVPAARR